MSENLKSVVSNLRGHESSKNWTREMFMIALIIFSVLNTFRLFTKSFGGLGVALAAAAVFVFDGGILFWEDQSKHHAKDKKQEGLANFMGTISIAAAGIMTVSDMILHSGQMFFDLDTIVIVAGYHATLEQVFSAAATLVLVGVFVGNLYAVKRFGAIDISNKLTIEARRVESMDKERELNVLKTRNLLQSQLTADSVEAMMVDYDRIKSETARQMSAQLMPGILAEWSGKLQGLPGIVVDGKFSERAEDEVVAVEDKLRAEIAQLQAELEAMRINQPNPTPAAQSKRRH